uniref:Uncharacterized protein n=1 Tax=Romanomermis culicivorax TaxID=13658 RepID=A0A915KGB8_ROMCU
MLAFKRSSLDASQAYCIKRTRAFARDKRRIRKSERASTEERAFCSKLGRCRITLGWRSTKNY